MEVLPLLISFLLLLLPTVTWALEELQGLGSLKAGSSLSVEKEGDLLVSRNGIFSSGFYKVGTNAYCFSIWFTKSANSTVVWMANRDRPVNGKQSKLTLQRNGNLVLTDADGSTIWSSNTRLEAAVEVQLLDAGNLVLINHANGVVWESFDFPTDTLLPSQTLTKNMKLISKRNKGVYLSGYYNFHFGDDNILNLIYNGPRISSVYWPDTAKTVFLNKRTPYNSTRLAALDQNGRFRSSDMLKFNASDSGLGPKRRLTLDYDGILRVYSLDEVTGLWNVSWLPSAVEACQVHGLCGANGICTYTPLPACSCPHGFTMTDPSDWSKGCSPSFNLTCNPVELDFMELYNTDYYGYDLGSWALNITLEACRNICLSDCRCMGFVYALTGEGCCFPKRFLLNGFHTPNSPKIMHIKVPRGMLFSDQDFEKLNTYALNCSGTKIVFINQPSGEGSNNRSYMKYLIAFVAVVAMIEVICIGLGWWYVQTGQRTAVHMGYIALAVGFKHFTYAELKRATQNFEDEIGKGGFGTVYKGVLDDERVVAVKRLEGIFQGDAEFWAEVSIIGKINHVNLVRMLGFCAGDQHKLLVYEYLENGSLDKILFMESSRNLDWDERYNIALGTAKGLAYLHEECLEWVLHCDIKPQNILLDEHLQPKVADFGMSKLVKNGQISGFSRVRGTRGYLAPEWMMNREINAKADVYSYGIVLLELLSGKNASGFKLENYQENGYKCNHLVEWLKQKIEQEGIMAVVDPRLNGEYNTEKVEKLVRVTLLCVGEDRDTRPTMSKVVELLIRDN